MLASELRECYQQFFEAHGHNRIRSVPPLDSMSFLSDTVRVMPTN